MDIASGVAENQRRWKSVPLESRPCRPLRRVDANVPDRGARSRIHK